MAATSAALIALWNFCVTWKVDLLDAKVIRSEYLARVSSATVCVRSEKARQANWSLIANALVLLSERPELYTQKVAAVRSLVSKLNSGDGSRIVTLPLKLDLAPAALQCLLDL